MKPEDDSDLTHKLWMAKAHKLNRSINRWAKATEWGIKLMALAYIGILVYWLGKQAGLWG